MKIVLESSIYAIFIAIICFISCDLIMMNMKVSKVNEDVQYVENYIEAYGTAETENDKKIYVWYKADENGNTVYETVKSNGKDVTRPAVLYKGMAADSYSSL